MAAGASRSRLLELAKLQCSIFESTFNPSRQRLGNKILRQRLKGPILASYYPRRSLAFPDLQKEFARFGLETWDDKEEDRLESLQVLKLRGKNPPKKKRVAEVVKPGQQQKKKR